MNGGRKGNPRDRDVLELIKGLRDFYGQYHHHKELMAYGATILYLTAASWFAFADQDPLGSGPERSVRITLLSALVIVAWSFIFWQLKQRRFAADIVHACTRILSRAVAEEFQVPLTDTRLYNGLQLPHFLVDELVAVAEARKIFRGTGLSELATHAAVAIWTALAVASALL